MPSWMQLRENALWPYVAGGMLGGIRTEAILHSDTRGRIEAPELSMRLQLGCQDRDRSDD